MLILKHFKNHGRCENEARREENGGKFDWKMDFWNLKILRMKKMWSWDYLKKLKSGKLFEEKDLENYFQKSRMMNWEMDTWPKGGHANHA